MRERMRPIRLSGSVTAPPLSPVEVVRMLTGEARGSISHARTVIQINWNLLEFMFKRHSPHLDPLVLLSLLHNRLCKILTFDFDD